MTGEVVVLQLTLEEARVLRTILADQEETIGLWTEERLVLHKLNTLIKDQEEN